jgi:protein-tyrosine phosphatase
MQRARSFSVALLTYVCVALPVACGDGNLPPSERAIPRDLPVAEREAARLLPLDGTHNFRDLGGYPTEDGRTTRWGVLYRSDALHDLSDDDLAYLARLGLRRVLDFRSAYEREKDPDRIPAGARVVLEPIRGEGFDPSRIGDMVMQADERDAVDLLLTANRSFVTDFSAQYRAYLLALADPEALPTLFHCTAGKDRAGFAAAIALAAAGVAREDIMTDYLKTAEYTTAEAERRIRLVRFFSLFRVDADALRALFGVRREYLQAAFDVIDAKYGGMDAYLREGLGLDDAMLARIRANLVE